MPQSGLRALWPGVFRGLSQYSSIDTSIIYGLVNIANLTIIRLWHAAPVKRPARSVVVPVQCNRQSEFSGEYFGSDPL